MGPKLHAQDRLLVTIVKLTLIIDPFLISLAIQDVGEVFSGLSFIVRNRLATVTQS